MQKTQPLVEHIAGSIERVTFHNPENGFCVLRVHINGKRELATVIGSSICVTAGEYIECTGSWLNNQSHGLQFKAEHMSVVQPATIAGMEKYLASGLVKGIGPVFAKKLITAFGLEVFEVIEKHPEKLQSLSGIGNKRKQAILDAWQEQKKVREIVVFLHEHGVGTARAVRIYKTYGEQSISIVKANPYRLAQDIYGIGFKTADTLALSLGIAINSPLRAQAGVLHVLQEHNAHGDCAAFVADLIQASVNLLAIDQGIIQSAISEQIEQKNLTLTDFAGTPAVFSTALYKAEIAVSTRICNLLKGATIWHDIDLTKAIPWVEKKTSISLSDSQREAVTLAIHSKVLIITGGPGVGKTTIVNSILKIIQAKTNKILLCAPTGRAAKRLKESTGIEAKTLHRLLAFEPQSRQFKHNADNPLDADLIVVDEVSMVDLVMMMHLLKAAPQNCAIIFVGDVDQLPSIGPGSVLANFIDSNKIPTVRLTQIYRQAASSQIILNAHKINAGKLPRLKYNSSDMSDFYFVSANSPEDIQSKLLTIVGTRIPKSFNLNPVRQIQVLTPMNRGSLGARSLNVSLKGMLNNTNQPEVQRFGTTFSAGDKVIQLVNNYDKEVYNGDIGFITQIDTEASQALIDFEDKVIQYGFDEFDELALAYAITIHKAQGSEYAAVVLPLAMQYYNLLERNLVYTGVTRGRGLVVIVGQEKALAMAIKNNNSGKRLTKLTQRLQELII
ncbi:MAG: ATP-dependent RecD-like DNA helicase [Rickettsiaceae bacterium]|nr:ATP-dependent RecD-like DNA helicase [Rickettsiaceae bacterium]